ncbi:UNVERIFIED_CONTAM: hypothetical protein GTU68_042847, partial [Idotea baltica]|nr:hypothetical protein [Idotea baltica]
PLSVDYQEKFAAAGRIPGGFLKREGRLGEHEILICRLVDRAIRPLFPDGYMNDTQVIINLISSDPEVSPDALAALAASSAITVSDIVFDGPISEVRVIRIDGKFKVNPSPAEMEEADIDMIVAATLENIMMVEGEMAEISEDEMLEAIKVAHEAIKIQCHAQIELAEMAGKTVKRNFEAEEIDTDLLKRVEDFCSEKIFAIAAGGHSKAERKESFKQIKEELVASFDEETEADSIDPYTIRIVADVLESNGSSSMATVCSGSLALMDAGVKISGGVSGIAMGMIADKEDSSRYAILSDILGDEDHLGDMDFKVTGTANGICACQMDIKVDGLSYDILKQALEQANKGRLHILAEMNKVMDKPREDFKDHTPRIEQIDIAKEFIGSIIGPGGKHIQELQKETETIIHIEEVDEVGKVSVSGEKVGIDAAIAKIKAITATPEVDEEYDAVVKSIMPYGAFVEFMPGKQGLLHISEISWKRLDSLEGIMTEGDKVKVKLIGVDQRSGKYKLSRKVLLPRPERKD